MSVILYKYNLESKPVRTSLKHGSIASVNQKLYLTLWIIFFFNLFNHYFWSSIFDTGLLNPNVSLSLNSFIEVCNRFIHLLLHLSESLELPVNSLHQVLHDLIALKGKFHHLLKPHIRQSLTMCLTENVQESFFS